MVGGKLMGKRAYLFCGLLLVCVFLAAEPAAAKVMFFDQGDDGSVVDARVNDLVYISLPENPTTGYLWDVQTTGGLTLRSDEFKRPFSYPPKVGAGGVRTWNYIITGTGTQEFSGSYHPAWLPAEEDDQHYSLTFNVQGSNNFSNLLAGKSSSSTAAQLLARHRANTQS
jgi:predicted secreted protein